MRKLRATNINEASSGSNDLVPADQLCAGGGGVDNNFLQLSTAAAANSPSDKTRPGPGSANANLKSDSVMYNKENISANLAQTNLDVSKNHSPTYNGPFDNGINMRGDSLSGNVCELYDSDHAQNWLPSEYEHPVRTNIKLNPLYHQYS